MAVTPLLVIVVTAALTVPYETFAEFCISVPAGVAVCANAGVVIEHTNRRIASRTKPWGEYLPIDAPKAGRLFTVPPACVGASNDFTVHQLTFHELPRSGEGCAYR